MKMNHETVEKTASLAGLELSRDDSCRFAADLDSILRYMEILDDLDTSDVPAFSIEALGVDNLRPDETGDSMPGALSNAPETKDGFFSVPRVIG